MHDDGDLIQRRLGRELRQWIESAVEARRASLSVTAHHVPGEPIGYDEARAASYEPFAVGQAWGRPWGTTWFRFDGIVPRGWSPSDRVEAVIDLGFDRDLAGFQAEGLVWAADGPVQGIHPRRTSVVLDAARPGNEVSLLVEAASNPMITSFRPSPLGSLHTAGNEPIYRLRRADLVVADDTVRALVADLDVLRATVGQLPADDPRRVRLLRTIERALDALDLADVAATAAAARAVLAPALALPARASAHRIVAVGHAHIDTAWLWPLRETVRKCARTFASAVRLMDDYPEYRFVCSQAAQYAWMEERYPSLFARMNEKVRAGQWIPVGGMWVEADMNLPSGESIVRQLVHGQRYFESRFGRRCEEVWIPDVFGYPGSLPQIFAAGGCRRFVTQKLSWNVENKFPHHTFWWEGIDGTRVLTHFPPVDTYNSTLDPAELGHATRNFREHGWSDWSLAPFGYGNGGGGPTREMLERARRVADLDGVARVEMGTPAAFFERVEAEIADGAPVPVWRGELYFEMHRGTLTSQSRTKVGNRRCEALLREAELWWAHIGTPAPIATELDSLWKDVLLQQFHDIIPGSSIAWVHEDAEAAHRRVATRLEELIAEALEIVSGGRDIIANATTHERDEVVSTDGGPVRVRVPGLACAPLVTVEADDAVVTTERSLENRFLAVTLDGCGRIASILDKRSGRQLLRRGRTVSVEIAPDHPVQYDAWDLEKWTRRSARAIDATDGVEVVGEHPLAGSIRTTRSFGRSRLTETVTLRAGSARLDVRLAVDWHEDEHLLSVAFPIDVHADTAACEVQFGHVRRPTHRSTSWDAAKFEVCAHRWVDLSEPSFGVAVLNDGRYGHDVQGDAVRVSILRAPKYPDPGADHGHHEVTLALLPHGPGLHDVLREAEHLDLPLRVARSSGPARGCDAASARLVDVDHPGVLVSAVKRSDDGRGDLVVRLYEAAGDRASVTVGMPPGATRASRVDLLEEPEPTVSTALEVVDGRARLELRPFELVTIRLS